MIKFVAIGVFAFVAFLFRGFAFVTSASAKSEPLSLLLLGVGLVSLGIVARKKLPLT